jgi:hypothetical protein
VEWSVPDSGLIKELLHPKNALMQFRIAWLRLISLSFPLEPNN